jgi:uncharacterized membrane protein
VKRLDHLILSLEIVIYRLKITTGVIVGFGFSILVKSLSEQKVDICV